ncbi:MAG: hypothetical protein ACI4D9_03890 [Lachnospiraceae bacterium]
MNAEKKDETKNTTLQKIEDLIGYAFPQIDKFPRQERSYGGLATKLRTTIMNMAERCMDTKKCFYPKSTLKVLNELDKEIQYAKFWTKTAYQMGYFNIQRLSVMNDYLDQIGKLTGSWIKTVMESEKESSAKK